MSSVAHFDVCHSRVVPLLVDDVDTDQIVPARFLKSTSRDGLAPVLFADWRKDPEFVLNHAQPGAQILVAGENFGCGSSREHAAWALRSWGFRAIVARSFADIFRGNALRNGIVPVALPGGPYRRILETLNEAPEAALKVDLRACQVTLPGGESFEFTVDRFARQCLLEGVDPLSYLLRFDAQIASFEARHD